MPSCSRRPGNLTHVYQADLQSIDILTHVYQADLQSIDILGSYDDSKAQVALQMRTEAGYGGDQAMVLRVPPGAGWMSNAS